MSRSVNKVILMGNLGKHPELTELTIGGKTVSRCYLSLATDESFTNDKGEKIVKTEWHRIVLWNKQAEISAKYLKKGSQVHIIGKLKTKIWDDEAGNTRYGTEVHSEEIVFINTPRSNNS